LTEADKELAKGMELSLSVARIFTELVFAADLLHAKPVK